jgi:hypothetical protein
VISLVNEQLPKKYIV